MKEGELKARMATERSSKYLRFDYENFVLSLHHLEPKQSVTMTLELMGFIIFPWLSRCMPSISPHTTSDSRR
ncbi:hypothetical protein PO124_29465 [Bacillus licheniformis]|nr:hypothetical protein [Bacillus licheniformis]